MSLSLEINRELSLATGFSLSLALPENVSSILARDQDDTIARPVRRRA
jgi:hypothetical protein